MTKYILFFLAIISSLQSTAQVEMADNFRGEGKIYVVITIILVILIGFFIMLIRLDKKTKQLEKEIEEK